MKHTIATILSAALLFVGAGCVATAAPVAEAKAMAHPLESVVPSSNDTFSDLEPLGAAIGDARIIGMGEATHGTSEFFSMKDRLFRYLVLHKGVTVFAMEANWSDTLAIDRYVTSGEGDPRKALCSTFAVWCNQETLDLITWMRAYNASSGNHPTLRVFGIDMQAPQEAARMLVAYAKAHPSATSVAADVTCMDFSQSELLARPIDAACVASTQHAIDTLSHRVPGADEMTIHAATIVHQGADFYSQKTPSTEKRDAAMAENLVWAARTLYRGTRIAVWAHDGHIMKQAFIPGTESMGMHLEDSFGASYYAIGFAFNGGSISPNGVNAPVAVPTAGPDTTEALWHSVGEPAFFVDLRASRPGTPFGDYVSRPQPMQMIGAIKGSCQLAGRFVNLPLSKAFDALIFIEESHAAHAFYASTQSDAGCNSGVPADVAGWSLGGTWSVTGINATRYEIGADTSVTRQGTTSLRLRSLPAADASSSGATINSIDVGPYLGHRIRVTGYLSTKDAGYSGAWLRVDGDGHQNAFDNMSDRLLRNSTPWTPFTIELNVAPDSKVIYFGTFLVGTGTVWADNLKVEIVP